MNIYLHVESVIRELDSKILLATIAASRGHQVLVSNLSSITRGIRAGLLAPGIFHTKSLTPGEDKILRHQKIIDNGFYITSIDEEGGLIDVGYDKFAKIRYSDKTINQSSAVFGWGFEDVNTLKKIYPKFSSKIYKTGSPRVDLWKSIFLDYWGIPKERPSKPYLLISSNFGTANNKKKPHELIASQKKGGYFQRDPEMFNRNFSCIADESSMMLCFINAIKHLSNNNNLYDIVLRPHPVEDVEAWKVYLEDVANVHVLEKGSITPWVNNSFAVLHNGCTTSLEASIAGKPVITYAPFEKKFNKALLANDLGYLIKTQEELLLKVNTIFHKIEYKNLKNNNEKNIDKISNKIFLDNNQLAAEKIIKVWESLDTNNLSQSSSWVRFQLFLNVMKCRDTLRVGLKNFIPNRFRTKEYNQKFPSLKKNDITERISKLQNILGIDKNLECKFLSDKTILIKQS